MSNIFSRTEKKYLLTKKQYDDLISDLQEYLIKEKFHEYKICNIYYDTNTYELFRKSIEKPVYKEKLRLRSYNVPDLNSKAFLEIKKKYKGVVYKRRIEAKLKDLYNFINNENVTIEDNMNEKEIRYLLKRYDLSAKVYLSYDREAYLWKDDNNLRITFDSNIKYRFNDVNLEKGDAGELLFDDGKIIMEIKSLNNFPLEFVKILSENKIYPVSFSKIGTIYKEKILKKKGN